ncbi:hypothetical protein I8J29_15925 [Paenibacillus sp. MWE-103]|uniref:Uncharacterized protein n=1 Tax=Paenibacillus artemisiicola TaxID=1172618 RepID=A0ABS3WBL3_9BACL|nr:MULTISPECIES: hypothetical protein [Paenibacillus]MBO7745700.1 hypothetical protein [Paenibacillus artemisiicola]SFI77311.1 hypothetical protein SAMN02799624_02115 [Paenibacillus sp. UNC496MF]
MALYRRLVSDEDFTEAMERQFRLRVYKDDHIVDSGGIIIRFDDQLVVSQSSVSDVTYHDRAACEFFEIRRR